MNLDDISHIISSLPDRVHSGADLEKLEHLCDVMIIASSIMLERIDHVRTAQEVDEKMEDSPHHQQPPSLSLWRPAATSSSSTPPPAAPSSPVAMDDHPVVPHSSSGYIDSKQFEPAYRTIAKNIRDRTNAKISKTIFCDVAAFLAEHGEQTRANNLDQYLHRKITEHYSGALAGSGTINLNKLLTDLVENHITRQGIFLHDDFHNINNGTSEGMARMEALHQHASLLMNHAASWGFQKEQLITIAKLRNGADLLEKLAEFNKTEITHIGKTYDLDMVTHNIKTNQNTDILKTLALSQTENGQATKVTRNSARGGGTVQTR